MLEAFKEQLIAETPNWPGVRRLALNARFAADDPQAMTVRVIIRLCWALDNQCWVDAVPLVRQLLYLMGGLSISEGLWANLRSRAEVSGIIGLPEEGHYIHLTARSWKASWLDGTEWIDKIERRTFTPTTLGDGMLNAMYPTWTNYRSEAQKAALDAWLFSPPGSTTLVTLPTGGGKSLCSILPAWFDSRGGRVNTGTTLVVVPTVALAFDQQKQARSFFKGSAQPHFRTGINTVDERMDIETRLRDGSLPILYTSPESLLGSRLREACLDAASDGLITRFVIDEAHLIESWGAGFRPEFQLLSAFRRQILEESQGELRTLLLSATVTERSREVLEQLFSEPGKLISVQANRLRPEIGYWFSFASNPYIRDERIHEALRFLPRPLILYVTQPEQAEQWVQSLRGEGYQRVETFTGNTQGDERQRILDEWIADKLDIIVGTSAFGLGVDKSDVRAIVHATLPENIDRYYQEVGRGGRDGFSASALLCTCQSDFDLAYSLNPKRITFEKAEPRWRAMLKTPSDVRSGDLRRIDRDAVPVGSHRHAVEVDRDWNDHLLLLLQRAGAIQIVEMPSGQAPTGAELMVRITNPQLLDDPAFFQRIFEETRNQELGVTATDQLVEIITMFSQSEASTCIGRKFAEIYDNVQIACGGCAYCRQNQQEPYGGADLDFQISYPDGLVNEVIPTAMLAEPIATKLGTWRTLNITWTGIRSHDSLLPMLDMLPLLLKLGFQQFAIPDQLYENQDAGDRLVIALAKQDMEYTVYQHRVIPLSWVGQRERSRLLPLPSVILYPPGDREADRIYQAVKIAQQHGLRLPACVNVVYSGLRLFSAGKGFTEHVDGLTEPFEPFQKWIRQVASTVY